MSFFTTYMLYKALNNNKNNNLNGYDDGLLLGGAIGGAIVLVACAAGGISEIIKKDDNNETSIVETIDMPTITFEEGKHLISVPVDGSLEEARQYEYHPGYRPLGIATAAYGKTYDYDGGTCILYVNDTEIVAKANGQVDGEFIYSDFGTPIDYEQKLNSESIETYDFPAGTHILSIPVNDPTDNSQQYEMPDGYEAIGIATASHGQTFEYSLGGCILYVNTEDVTCKKTEDGKYINFGTPKEEVKVKVKQ